MKICVQLSTLHSKQEALVVTVVGNGQDKPNSKSWTGLFAFQIVDQPI